MGAPFLRNARSVSPDSAFRLGTEFEITSNTEEEHFKLHVNVDEWIKDDSNDWTFQLSEEGCNRRWAAAADAVTNGRPAVVAAGQFNRSLSA